MTSVTVGGSVIGSTGGSSGLIVANLGTLGPVQITGNLQGGSVSGILSIGNSGYIFGSRITSVSITGSLISGTISGTGKLFNSGAIRATYDIGSINVGNLVGNSTNPVVISARGQNPATLTAKSTTDLAIASITVGSAVKSGNVSFTNILAGYDPSSVGVNAAAQIGAVTVHGNWTASNLVAGVAAGPDGYFGTADDTVLSKTDAPNVLSQIGPILITGTVSGNSSSSTAHFGIVAQKVTSLTIGTKVITVTVGTPVSLGTTANTSVYALGGSIS